MSDITVNYENATKCLCSNCPVQENSTCTINKIPNYQEKLKNLQAGTGNSIPAEEMVSLHCSSDIGKSSCKDLNCNALCACPECEVGKNAGLTGVQFCI
jgi:hypothetical protein